MIFLRPWFLLMAGVLLVFWVFKKHLQVHNPLENFVDKRLLPFLTVHFQVGLYRLKMRWFVFFWLLFTLAGAGPAFDKISVPAVTSTPASVIVMDMSPAMSGDNLTKAKLKLYDLLMALKGQQVGLVLYDEKGYTASPVTQDIEVIQNMIPALSPAVMPRPLNRPAEGFKQADILLKNAGIKKGHIIFITAGGFDETDLKQTVRFLPHTVTTLAIQNDGVGYPVPIVGGDFMRHSDGTPVLVKPDAKMLSQIGTYIPMSVSDSDIQKITVRTSEQISDTSSDMSDTASVWKDMGPYLLFLGIAFFIWVFRKGVFFVLLIICLPFGANAGLFERTDQEMYRKIMSGVRAYQNGNFEAARQVFETGKTADDFYNAGNARAHLNDIQGAIEAYDKALKINPEHVQAAWNKEYLKRQMPPQQNPENNTQNQEQKNNQSQGQNNQNGQSDSQQNQSEPSSENMSENTQVSDNQDMTQNQSEPSQSGETVEEQLQNNANERPNVDMNNNEQKPAQNEMQQPETQFDEDIPTEQAADTSPDANTKEFDQESKQLLNKIKQDPSRLLRYRLLQQYMRKTQ